MNPSQATGMLLGLMLASGLLLIISWVWRRRPSLQERVAPYLRLQGHGASGSLTFADQYRQRSLGEQLLGPSHRALTRLIERIGPSTQDLKKRLARAGQPMGVEEFRGQQITWTVIGLVCGGLMGIWFVSLNKVSPLNLVVLCLTCALVGLLSCDYRLGQQIKEREVRIATEFPTIAELLALAVGAGENPISALERVSRTAHGELANEFAYTLSDVRSGTSITQALLNMAERCDLPSVTRFAEGIAVAVERGTPLAHVLRDQAQDVREIGRQQLIATGARKEVLMLIPVVFLVLPVTVIFAVLPSVITLQVGL